MYDIINDLATITTVPNSSLDKLVNKANWCISHCVNECMINDKDVVEMDIGIGKLYIKLDNNLKYKFIPSDNLSKCINDTIQNKKSPLICAAEESLSCRLRDTYKDYFKNE